MTHLFGKTKPEALDQIYYDTVENLRGLIDTQFPSIKNFCELNKIDRFNLCKIFANKYQKEMSIGLYLRCLVGLGYVDKSVLSTDDLGMNVSLRDYIKIDNNLIMQSVVLMQY